jgi:hypothetical protein
MVVCGEHTNLVKIAGDWLLQPPLELFLEVRVRYSVDGSQETGVRSVTAETVRNRLGNLVGGGHECIEHTLEMCLDPNGRFRIVTGLRRERPQLL